VKQPSTFTAACALNDAEVILVKDPPEAACHSRPVAVALFATILQEQSQRIVLRGLEPVNPQGLSRGLQVLPVLFL